MYGHFAAFAAVGVLLASPAAAADAALAKVSAVKGAVLVSQDGKFTPASNTTSLKAGDRLVAKDGEASIRYSDGCLVTLKPNAMATIGAASPCAAGPGLVTPTSGDSAQFLGLSGFGAAVVVFGALALILILVSDDDDDPVSP